MASQRLVFRVLNKKRSASQIHLIKAWQSTAAAAASQRTSATQKFHTRSQSTQAAPKRDDDYPDAAAGVPVDRKIDPLDMTFLNHEAAFKSKSTMQVLRGYVVYQLCSIGFLVENNETLMNIGKKVLGETLFAKIMKMTFYGHFVAGENRAAIKPVIHRMHSFGVKSILDYSVEEDLSESQAKKIEMESLDSAPQDAKCDVPSPNGGPKIAHTEEMKKKFTPSEEFGDRRKHVSSARTYFYQNEAKCEKQMETFLRCIEAVAHSTGSTGMAAIKVTALGRPNLLLQLSEVIVRSHKYFQEVTGQANQTVQEGQVCHDAFSKRFKEDQKFKTNPEVEEWLGRMTHDKKGLIHLFSWSGLIDSKLLLKDTFQVPCLKTGQMQPLIKALTSREEEQFRNMLKRLHTVLSAAQEMDVRVMIDAEQSYFQPAIHRLAMEMMKKYNQEKAIVFNTYQCYLKSAYKNLVLDLEQAQRQNFYFGAKLVRGAYMEQERLRAEQLGYEDPINPNYDATSDMYHRCLAECMERMRDAKALRDGSEKRVGIMVASHNADTIRFAIEKMKEYDIKGDERLICFGQLLGMCDNLTFPLGQAGYSVYKYVPYGPVNEVLPYLSRRARENKGILQKLEIEKALLRKELFSRIKQGKLRDQGKGEYLPVGFDRLPELSTS